MLPAYEPLLHLIPIRYHEDKMVNFNLQDGYSVLTLPKATPSTQLDDDDVSEDNKKATLLDSFNLIQGSHHTSHETPTAASSVLLVHEVKFNHAGNYTCAPSNTNPTNIIVHVLKGEFARFARC